MKSFIKFLPKMSLALAGIACAVLALPLGVRANAADETAGVTVIGDEPIFETTQQIMEREKAKQAEGDFREDGGEHNEVPNPDRSHLAPNPDAQPVSQWPPMVLGANPAGGGGGTPRLMAPQTVALDWLGPASTSGGGPFPHDTMGCVGPTQFLAFTNGRVVTYSRTTGTADGVLNTTPDTFFQSVRNGSFCSDPRVRFDRLANRWIMIIINVATPNRILFATSSNATLTAGTTWTFTQFTNNSTISGCPCLADYPTLGVDANALYIGVNEFTSTSYVGSSVWVVRKSSIFAGGTPIVATLFDNLTSSGTGPYTPQGVDNFDAAATQGYFVGVDVSAFSKLVMRRVSTPGATPTISSNLVLTVPTTASPLKVPHLGNSGGTNGNIDSGDDRLFAAHFRNGRLWSAHSIQVNTSGVGSSSGGRNGIRWYEIQNLTATPSLVQSGTVWDTAASSPRHYTYPTVMVSGQGHVAVGATAAGAAERINAFTTGRLSGDASGTMRNSGVVASSPTITASSTAYNPSGNSGAGDGFRRWGDYSYTSLDPNDDMTMWTIQEYCSASNISGCRIAKLLAPAPTLNNPGDSANQGTVGKSVSLTGTGFYDPGAGFTGRLGVAVSGGTINGISNIAVTYNSATSATVTFDIAANATPGTRNVVLTNPDGQSVTASAGFTVTAASAVNDWDTAIEK